jgi:hypothetical protein
VTSWEHRPIWHLTLPWERPLLMANDSSSLRGQMRTKASVRDDTAMIARQLKLPPIAVPVVAVLSWYHRTRRAIDSDNIAPTLKRCLDGLQLAGVLENDSGHHVRLTAQRCIPKDLDPFVGGRPRVVLSLYDASDFLLPHPEPSPCATLTAASRL